MRRFHRASLLTLPAVAMQLLACSSHHQKAEQSPRASACGILTAALATATDTTVLIAVLASEANSSWPGQTPHDYGGYKQMIAHQLQAPAKDVSALLDPQHRPESAAMMPKCSAPARTTWQAAPPRMPGDTLMVSMSLPRMLNDSTALVYVAVTDYPRTEHVTLSDGPAGHADLIRLNFRNQRWVVTKSASVWVMLRM